VFINFLCYIVLYVKIIHMNGLHKSNLIPILLHNLNMLKLSNKTRCALWSHLSVGIVSKSEVKLKI